MTDDRIQQAAHDVDLARLIFTADAMALWRLMQDCPMDVFDLAIVLERFNASAEVYADAVCEQALIYER